MKKKNNCLFFDRYRDFWITFCSIVLILLFIIFIIISIFYKFNFIVSYNGFVVCEEDYYVVVYIDDNGIQNIKKNVLVVDKAELDYSIVKISDEYILSDNGPVRGVFLKFHLNDSDKIINNVLKLNFVYKSSIFNFVKEKFL